MQISSNLPWSFGGAGVGVSSVVYLRLLLMLGFVCEAVGPPFGARELLLFLSGNEALSSQEQSRRVAQLAFKDPLVGASFQSECTLTTRVSCC